MKEKKDLSFDQENNEESLEEEGYFSKFVSITEAAKINQVTRQAVYVAIKQKKLSARKYLARWVIHLDDLEKYRSQRYSRTRTIFDGELLFDKKKGSYSISQASSFLKISQQKIYYAIRIGHLKAVRRGVAWVVYIEDILSFKEKYMKQG